MRRLRLDEKLRDHIQALRQQGAYLKPLEVALRRLQHHQDLNDFKDHPLRGKLKGYRACHVGMLPRGVSWRWSTSKRRRWCTCSTWMSTTPVTKP